MEALANLVIGPVLPEMISVQQKSYVTYCLSEIGEGMFESAETRSITLLESRFLLASAGTTGFRTWEACLHLGQYLLSQPDSIRGKRILELGAGTGYISILCSKYLGAARVIASDGSDDVLNHLPENFFLNDLQHQDNLSVLDLKWGHALVGTEEEKWIGGATVDIVLGADITYDINCHAGLVATLLELFDLHPHVCVIMAATERNSSTLDSFIKRCKSAGIRLTQVDFCLAPGSSQTGPFYDTSVPVPIFKCLRPGVEVM
jgi:predicted nicotinamide N-methyase